MGYLADRIVGGVAPTYEADAWEVHGVVSEA
jgi:hypothetical protein